MTKPEPRLFALNGRRGGPKKRSNGPKNSWNGSSSPPPATAAARRAAAARTARAARPAGPPSERRAFTSCVLEMFTTDGETCSARSAKSGSVTTACGGVARLRLAPLRRRG